MLRFAANLTMLFWEQPFPERFAAARQAGFDAVECQFPYEMTPDAVAAELAAHDLRMPMFNTPPGDKSGGGLGCAAIADRFDEMCAGIDRAISYARTTGAGMIHLLSGFAPRTAETRQAYQRSLNWAAERVGEHGIDLLIEPLNGRDAPGYFLGDFAEAVDIIQASGLPNLKLLFDVYHRQIMAGDVLRALREMLPIIGHVQISAVPDRHEPGSGELNDDKILRELVALGYQGWVGCEYRPAGATVEGLDWKARWPG